MSAPAGSPGRITRLGGRLAAAEARLIGAELRRAMRWTAAATALAGAAATVGVGAGACFVAAVVLGLATAMPAWLAALVAGAVLLVVAGFLALLAREAAKDAAAALRQTTDRAQEEARWMGTLISSNGR
jgi:formate hydrogenlyase subunit 3/multisubunit Na+/H+ antiporter MnhD subunit